MRYMHLGLLQGGMHIVFSLQHGEGMQGHQVHKVWSLCLLPGTRKRDPNKVKQLAAVRE